MEGPTFQYLLIQRNGTIKNCAFQTQHTTYNSIISFINKIFLPSSLPPFLTSPTPPSSAYLSFPLYYTVCVFFPLL